MLRTQSALKINANSGVGMANRREFIQNGFVTTLLAGLGCLPPAVGGARAELRTRISRAIYDVRYEDSRRFAEQAVALGVLTHGIQGDITEVWFTDLDALWRDRKGVVAGLTTEAALFCLERFAWDHQMRVVFRAEHVILDSGCMQHTISCPSAKLGQIDPVASQDSDWVPQIARAMQQRVGGGSPNLAQTFTTPLSDKSIKDADLLTSWVIAPT
jgi:hypothetical protein